MVFKSAGLKKVLLGIGIFAGLVLIVNWKFFWLNIKYSLTKPKAGQVIEQTEKSLAINSQSSANTLKIPSLEIESPVVYVEAASEKIFQSALAGGVVHYPNTAKVGQVGNVYIFGHSSDVSWSKGNFKTVFALLPRVEIGAEIFLSNETGEQFEYIVTEKFVASAKDVYLLSQDTAGKKILTLQTSWPVGTALKRYIVRAKIKE